MIFKTVSTMGLDRRGYPSLEWPETIERLRAGLSALDPRNFPKSAVLVSTTRLRDGEYETMAFPITLGHDHLGYYRRIHYEEPIDFSRTTTEADALGVHKIVSGRYILS